MENIGKVLNILSTVGIADIVDIIVVALVIFKLIMFVRNTNSHNLARAIIVLIVAMLVAELFNLNMISYFIRRVFELGLIAVIILFQPELRRMMETVGGGFAGDRHYEGSVIESAITQTVLACSDMSESKTGALIIFERSTKLSDIMTTGTIINADTTSELLKNMFFNKAPLHDGAVIIRDGRIAAAGCVLPLTQSKNLSKDLGMRHRAGIGLSEQSDAVVVIVSEETGAISVAIDGMLKRHLTPATFGKILHSELVREDNTQSKKTPIYHIKKFFQVNNNEENKSNEKII